MIENVKNLSDFELYREIKIFYNHHVDLHFEACMRFCTMIEKQISKKQKDPAFTKLKATFEEFYKKKFDREFIWSAAESVGLNGFIKKVKIECKSKEIEPTEKVLNDSLLVILNNISDTWMLNNLSFKILNSRFNETINTIKNGRTKKGNSKAELRKHGIDLAEAMQARGYFKDVLPES